MRPTEATRMDRCMIEDMADIIGSRQTVRFELTTSRISGTAWVLIAGPDGTDTICVKGPPGDWQALLAEAIRQWREAMTRE